MMSLGSKLLGGSLVPLFGMLAVGCGVGTVGDPRSSSQNSREGRGIPLGLRWTGSESSTGSGSTGASSEDSGTTGNPGNGNGTQSSTTDSGATPGSDATTTWGSSAAAGGDRNHGNTSSTSPGSGSTSSTSDNGNTSSGGGRGGSTSASNEASRGGNGGGTEGTKSETGGSVTYPTPTPCALTGPARVENPYVGAKGYVNPEWKARADAEPGGDRVSDTPTGVWMDRIAAIDGSGSSSSMSMRAHLDAALAQNAGYIQFVIYDLPGRDCAALSSNGELGPTEIDRYEHEYIDPIATILCDEKYSSLRIVNIIEIDSLPNLVTNTGSKATATAACDTMKSNGNYQKGIQYALSQLHKIPNTYNYIDAGHHGWIGWDDNLNDSAALIAEVAKSAEGGADTVQGFITNTANYSALSEPYLTVTDDTRQSDWIDWNRYVDETTFAKAFRSKLISLGLSSGIGMLIDTSRNGWGGQGRPTAASTASDLNTRIDESRIDRRAHPGNWCNQSGAGLGERPRAVDADGIDAYVWIKPPGESDGASQAVENDQGKGVDGMCDPSYAGNARNGNSKSGALPNAPLSGAWFSAQFQELMQNAYPPL